MVYKILLLVYNAASTPALTLCKISVFTPTLRYTMASVPPWNRGLREREMRESERYVYSRVIIKLSIT